MVQLKKRILLQKETLLSELITTCLDPGDSRRQKIRHEFSDIENLNEERIEELLERFLEDFQEGKLKSNGWSTTVPAYNISKAVLNTYTRLLANR